MNYKIIVLDFVNAFLVKLKDGFILIDTGMPQHWERLEAQLTAEGCLPSQLKLVVITHGDRDHLGNCAQLQEKYKVKIAMHEADSLMAEGGVLLKRKARTLAAKILMLLFRLRRPKVSVQKFKPDILLRDGQDLKAYGWDAKIIHLPGHTKGSIGILTAEGDLFVGDTLVNYKKPDRAIFVDDPQELKNSIEKLRTLKINKVYPGHGKIFSFSDFVCLLAIILLISPGIIWAQQIKPIQLLAPQTQGGKPLMQALKDRKSTRAFSSKELSLQVISDMLWAAFGINRPDSGQRTAPSAMNLQEIDIYVAKTDGLYLFDAKANILTPVVAKDLRYLTGNQPFVSDAPINLIYVADLSKMNELSATDADFYAAADTGFISENVYLFCASGGLATVVRGSMDKPALAHAMQLRDNQKIILAQTIGYPHE